MIFSREQLDALEDKQLAIYGSHSKYSRGRQHHEDEPAYRTRYQRDRDRILHTTAFRRLEYKTQVFINYEGDYYRTRLTHTLEVAQIGRTIARALGVNEDLTETICLAHDLGHPPFGHAGEDALNKLIADVSDELAYNAHDLDDGLKSGLIVTDQLKELEIWNILCDRLNWHGHTLSE